MELDVRVQQRHWHGLGETVPGSDGTGIHYPSHLESNVLLLAMTMTQSLAISNPELIVSVTGATTGTLVKRLPDMVGNEGMVWAFCHDMDIRNAMVGDAYFIDQMNVCMKDGEVIDSTYVSATDFLIVDSPEPWCWADLAMWVACGKKGSVLLIPRTSMATAEIISHMKVRGARIKNTSKTFIAQRGRNDNFVALTSQLWSGIIERSAQML